MRMDKKQSHNSLQAQPEKGMRLCADRYVQLRTVKFK